MADGSSLRFIGLSFGAITAAVALVAVLLVVSADRDAVERSSATATVSRAG